VHQCVEQAKLAPVKFAIIVAYYEGSPAPDAESLSRLQKGFSDQSIHKCDVYSRGLRACVCVCVCVSVLVSVFLCLCLCLCLNDGALLLFCSRYFEQQSYGISDLEFSFFPPVEIRGVKEKYTVDPATTPQPSPGAYEPEPVSQKAPPF